MCHETQVKQPSSILWDRPLLNWDRSHQKRIKHYLGKAMQVLHFRRCIPTKSSSLPWYNRRGWEPHFGNLPEISCTENIIRGAHLITASPKWRPPPPLPVGACAIFWNIRQKGVQHPVPEEEKEGKEGRQKNISHISTKNYNGIIKLKDSYMNSDSNSTCTIT